LTQVELIEIKRDPLYAAVNKAVEAGLLARGAAEALAQELAEKETLAAIARRDGRFNQTFAITRARDQLAARVNKVGGLAIKILQRQKGVRFEGSDVKRIFAAINTKKSSDCCGRVEHCDAEGIKRHDAWVLALEAQLMRGEMPVWLW
jgi:hypothetical protein